MMTDVLLFVGALLALRFVVVLLVYAIRETRR